MPASFSPGREEAGGLASRVVCWPYLPLGSFMVRWCLSLQA